MSGSTPFVDNDLLSSLVETLLVFEHLFDTGYRGVSRGASDGWRDRKPATLLAFSRFWKPIAQTPTFVETKGHLATLLDAPPLFGCRERRESSKRFPKT